MKTSILLISLLITIISCQWVQQQVLTENSSCDSWFPEPVKSTERPQYSYLRRRFLIVDDFLEDKDDKEWERVTKKYVVDSLDGDVLSSFQITKIVLGNLPSIRSLFISLTCCMLAELIFFAIWRLSFIDVFYNIGVYLKFHHHRYGLTFFPVVGVMVLLILNSHFIYVTDIAIDGLRNLETGDDANFMPIKTRIDLMLTTIPCNFQKQFKERRNETDYPEVPEEYFEEVLNGTYFQLPPTFLFANTSQCRKYQSQTRESSDYNFYDSYPRLRDLIFSLEDHYLAMTTASLSESLKTFSKALGSIEEFVERYHEEVLQIPTQSTIGWYYRVTVAIAGVTVAVTCAFVALLVLKVHLKRNWQKILTYCGIGFMVLCSTLCVTMFLTIFIKIAFILLTQTASTTLHFDLFNASRHTVISEKGYVYNVNYADYLWKSAFRTGTWFSLVKNHTEYRGRKSNTPQALDGKRLWNPSKAYNETFKEVLKVAEGYRDFHKTGCEGLKKLYELRAQRAKELGCTEPEVLKDGLERLKTYQEKFCSQEYFDKFKVPTPEVLTQRSWDFWKHNLIPRHGYGIISREKAVNNFGTMQIYQVLMNPTMKLRPNVLEPWFAMASLILAMAPVIFILALFLMCITPELMKEEKQLRSGSKSSSTSFSASAPLSSSHISA